MIFLYVEDIEDELELAVDEEDGEKFLSLNLFTYRNSVISLVCKCGFGNLT